MKMIRKRQDLPNLKETSARIGVFGVGYDKYWEQFPGLLEELMQKHETIIQKFSGTGVTVSDFGMVDNPEKAYAVVRELEAASLDMVFCNMLTYATSGTFGVIVRALSIPVILVALQPLKALDYSKASTYMQLANDDICSLPEFAGVAVRMGKRVPEVIIGTLYDDPQVDAQLDEFCRIARVLHDLKNAHFGHLASICHARYAYRCDYADFDIRLPCS